MREGSLSRFSASLANHQLRLILWCPNLRTEIHFSRFDCPLASSILSRSKKQSRWHWELEEKTSFSPVHYRAVISRHIIINRHGFSQRRFDHYYEINRDITPFESEREREREKGDFPRDFALPEKRREKANRETGHDTVFQFSIQRRKSRWSRSLK